MKYHLLIFLLVLSTNFHAQEFKSYNVNYKLKGKDVSNTVSIPQYKSDSPLPIRGVMQIVNGPLKEFAHKNQVAMFAKPDEGRGFSKELLAAAAKVSLRPEIKFAGAIVQGVSRGGREAADWAAANQQRAIAIILDHSAIWSMSFPKRVSGVPMYFNATYQNMYQNIDRRKSHFEWCTAAFKAKIACTAIIDHVKDGGHGGRGSTDLTAIWLDEAMAYRVPVNIPVGKPYALVDINPSKVGGYVSAKISMDGKRAYHDKVKITLKRSNSKWWIPGPRTAAKYLDWVRKNGGTVDKDESAEIKNFPIFIDLTADLKRAVGLIKGNQWSQAYTTLQKMKSSKSHTAAVLTKMINSQIERHLNLMTKLNEASDLYSLFLLIQKNSRIYRGIPEYDEKFNQYVTMFKNKKNAALLKIGRDFHTIIERINKTKKLNEFNLGPLKNFASKNSGNAYGKAAQTALSRLNKDLSLKLSPENYFIN